MHSMQGTVSLLKYLNEGGPGLLDPAFISITVIWCHATIYIKKVEIANHNFKGIYIFRYVYTVSGPDSINPANTVLDQLQPNNSKESITGEQQ